MSFFLSKGRFCGLLGRFCLRCEAVSARQARYIVLPVLLCLVFTRHLSAQTQDILPLGITPATASVAYIRQWQPFSNPASLSNVARPSLSLVYENRYFHPHLSDAAVAFSSPTPYFNIAGAYNFFGFDSYHEMLLSLAVSRRFGKVALGIEADYFNLRISPEDGYRHAVTAQVGIQAFVSDRLVIGARVFNPVFSRVKSISGSRNLPVLLQLGCSYSPNRQFDILTQFSYTIGAEFQWAVGCEYRIVDFIVARAGIRGADYILPSLGAGFRYENYSFDLMAEADFAIGMSLLSNLSICF